MPSVRACSPNLVKIRGSFHQLLPGRGPGGASSCASLARAPPLSPLPPSQSRAAVRSAPDLRHHRPPVSTGWTVGTAPAANNSNNNNNNNTNISSPDPSSATVEVAESTAAPATPAAQQPPLGRRNPARSRPQQQHQQRL
ncbi:hypothetical protein VTG60DRAFT_4278 [Thermothelomyces hinnuleus]